MPRWHIFGTSHHFVTRRLGISVKGRFHTFLAIMQLYPLFADLSGRHVLVVGGGDVAARKVTMLLAANACVTVGAPTLTESLQALKHEGRIVHCAGLYQSAWWDGVWLAIAATDSVALNARVAADGHANQRFVNVVDDPVLSSFQLPALIDRSPLIVAVSTTGIAPVLARRVREQIESMLDPAIGPLLQLAQRYRTTIRRKFSDLGTRRRFYDWLHDGPVAALLRSARPAAAVYRLEQSLAASVPAATGLVTLVGAGPGDPGLLTLRALRALNEADVILHDALISPAILDLARRDAERISVGKRGGGVHTPQETIHALLRQHAQQGKNVVRLKGGDSFVFGRGGEELEFLRTHGIAYAVVPGITAALACAAYTGVPLTHRELAQSVRLITAHCRESLDTLDWPELARDRQTLAVYMGVSELGTLTQQLLAHGRAGATPFVLVENGSLANQRTLTGALEQLPALAQHHAIQAPALLIIGEVAALAGAAHWYGELLDNRSHHSALPAHLADAA